MLFFKTGTCTVKRQGVKTWYKSSYETIHTWVEIDLQPDLGQALWIDKVKGSYKAYICTDDRDLVQYNDLIVDWDNKEYVVQNSEFWKGQGIMESSIELDLILNVTE